MELTDENTIDTFFKDLEESEKKMGITVSQYSERSFLISGDTKQYKEELKSYKGSWNRTLGGWIFSIKHRENINDWILNFNQK
jgi:hypothetical protein